MSWSHTESEKIFSYRRTLIDLPVIVLSSVNGFLSVGSSSLFPGGGNSVSSALGAVSLFVAVLNTLGSYFSWAKRAEAHRIAAIHYAKLYRFINVEMSLPREERTPPSEFLKYIKEQYDHLNEMSPPLPAEVIKSFHRMFSEQSLKEISVPEQMNGIEAIHVYDAQDLKNDLDLEMATKVLETEHAANIDNIPGRPEMRSDYRRDSIVSVLPPIPPQVSVSAVPQNFTKKFNTQKPLKSEKSDVLNAEIKATETAEVDAIVEATVAAAPTVASDIHVVLEEWASNLATNNPNIFLSALPESVESSGRESPANDSDFPKVLPMD